MNERMIGELIRIERKKLHLTQEELSEGICEPTTLSRIENNKQDPTRNVLNALLQRLGISDSRFYAVVTEDELKINNLCNDIASYNVKFEKSDMTQKKSIKKILEKKHEELIKLIEPDDVISTQFLLKSQILIEESSNEKKLERLLEAIKLTHPSFELSTIKNGLYSFDEVALINQIAVVYSENKESEKAIGIWEQLLRNIDDRFFKIAPVRTQKDLILYGLSRELLIEEKYKKALEYAEEGKQLSIDFGIYQHLPGFIIILAECEYRLENINRSKELFKDAYFLCRVIGDKANEKIVIDANIEYFGYNLS